MAEDKTIPVPPVSRGGRPPLGRESGASRSLSLRIRDDQHEWLAAQPTGRAQTIRDLIDAAMQDVNGSPLLKPGVSRAVSDE